MQTKQTRKTGRTVLTVIAVILLLLLIADIIAGNYLVSFAVKRRTEKSKSVAPEAATTSATQTKVDENAEILAADTEEWLSTAASEAVTLTSGDGLSLRGDIFTNPEGGHQWVIMVHGYGARRIYMYDYVRMHAQHGYHVLLPDLRAHGDSEGDYIGMGWLDRKDMLGWINMILERDPEAEIILHGVSMGGATVMMTAGEDLPANVKAVVDDCGYTSVRDIFSDELDYLFGLPEFPFLYTADVLCKLRAGYSFREASAIEQIRKTQVPVLFLHGAVDNFVHTEMVYELYDACPTQKDLYVAPEAGHGEAFYIDPEVYESKVFGFLDEVLN